VTGLHPKFDSVSFIDAASMATGFGGQGYVVHASRMTSRMFIGSPTTMVVISPSHETKKCAHGEWLSPYPWDPGTSRLSRSRLLCVGGAVDGFLKSVRDRMPMLGHVVWGVFGPLVIAPTSRVGSTTFHHVGLRQSEVILYPNGTRFHPHGKAGRTRAGRESVYGRRPLPSRRSTAEALIEAHQPQPYTCRCRGKRASAFGATAAIRLCSAVARSTP